MVIYLDLGCKSNSLKNAEKKFYSIEFCIVNVKHCYDNNYIAESSFTLEQDEIQQLKLTNDNIKDFNFYNYFENKIALKHLRTKTNKTGIFVSHIELHKNTYGEYISYLD